MLATPSKSSDGGTQAFDFSAIDDHVAVEFTVDIHRNPDGTSPVFRHTFLIPESTEALDDSLAKLSQATAGLSGADRLRANRKAIVSLWASIVVEVGGYAPEINVLRGKDLVDFFEGKRIPAGIDDKKRARAVAAMFAHVDAAVSGYLLKTQPQRSFR